MSWGNKLVIVYVAFVALMGFLIYKCVNTKYDLVSKDYYKDELRYQDKIDGMANAAKVSDIDVSQNADYITIDLPKELNGDKPKGDVWFYCATDDRKDKKFPMNIDMAGKQLILKSLLPKTKYLVKLNWKTTDNKIYYAEKELTVL